MTMTEPNGRTDMTTQDERCPDCTYTDIQGLSDTEPRYLLTGRCAYHTSYLIPPRGGGETDIPHPSEPRAPFGYNRLRRALGLLAAALMCVAILVAVPEPAAAHEACAIANPTAESSWGCYKAVRIGNQFFVTVDRKAHTGYLDIWAQDLRGHGVDHGARSYGGIATGTVDAIGAEGQTHGIVVFWCVTGDPCGRYRYHTVLRATS